MDGLTEYNTLIVGTTNRIDIIDPSLMRPGRFDLHLKIDYPNKE